MPKEKLIMYTDGGARGNPGSAGAGVFITDESGKKILSIAKPLGVQTNNFAEYEAVIAGLEGLKKKFGKQLLQNMDIEVRADSELIVKQLNGEYQIKEPTLHAQFIKVWNLRVTDFPNISFTHIPREKNKDADRLSNEAMDMNDANGKLL